MAPVSVSVPVPVLVRPPVPLSTPENVVLVFAPPTVKLFAPRVTAPPVVPPPASDAIVSLLARFNVAPLTLAKVTAEASGRADPPEAVSVPALMVMVPVYVFVPLRVSVPVPLLTRLPVPLITPA